MTACKLTFYHKIESESKSDYYSFRIQELPEGDATVENAIVLAAHYFGIVDPSDRDLLRCIFSNRYANSFRLIRTASPNLILGIQVEGSLNGNQKDFSFNRETSCDIDVKLNEFSREYDVKVKSEFINAGNVQDAAINALARSASFFRYTESRPQFIRTLSKITK